MSDTTHAVRPIGIVRSPWPDKFGVPRQAGLARARMQIELDRDRIPAEALRGLEMTTHIWVVVVFDRIAEDGWHPTVRPPRLGGNVRKGVLATRSPFRPGRLGLSAVRLLAVEYPVLEIEGGDFVDGTPVVDIKPYVAWTDAITDAKTGWGDEPPARRAVRFSPQARTQLDAHPRRDELAWLIEDTLALDPRPAYLDPEADKTHGVRILDVDVAFVAEGDGLLVVQLVRDV